MIDIKSYDRFMISKAKNVALLANCLRRKVGAVLTQNPHIISRNYEKFENVDFSEAILSTGSNRCLDGDKSCEEIGCFLVDGHCYRTIHAEINCINNNKFFGCTGKWLYVTTAPCIKCFQYIVLMGITTVKYEDGSYWQVNPTHQKYIENLARKYNILVEGVL